VSLYLDASILVALFVIDPGSARAAAFLSAHPTIVIVSDFGAAESPQPYPGACACTILPRTMGS
jgi:hypothetical protein